MPKFSRLPACLIMTGLLAVGAIAASAGNAEAATTAGGFATCTATGNNTNCATAGTVSRPVTLTVTVTTNPVQSVIVAWNDTCSQGGSTVSKSGTFTATTPVTRVIPHAFTQPDSCIVAAASGVEGFGTVHVTLSSSSSTPAPAHEIKGYAGMCADDSGNSVAPRTKIVAWTCSNSAAEQWTFSHGELVHRGMCMNDKAGGGSGSPVVLYTCNGSAGELWTRNSHGEYVLKAHQGTLCLTDPGFSKKNGTQLVVSTCHDTANQRWTLP